MAQMEQLELFSWDFEVLGQGGSALEQLDFKMAQKVFQEILVKINDHEGAQRGLTLCCDWGPILQKKRRMDKINACEFLWKAILQYSFGNDPMALGLRKTLLGMLAREVEHIAPHLFSDSGLCLGQIYLELEEPFQAIQAFDPLLEHYPYEPLLFILYGNTLWQAGDMFQAKIQYIKALLISPSEVLLLPIKDKELLELVQNQGPYMAPLYEWLKHDMPPLKLPKIYGENLEHNGALEVYQMMVCGNEMEGDSPPEQVEAFRKNLQTQAPDIFEVYMEKIKMA